MDFNDYGISFDALGPLEIDVNDYPGHPGYLSPLLTPVQEPERHIRDIPLATSTPIRYTDLGSDGELSPTLSENDTFLFDTINDGPELDVWDGDDLFGNAWNAFGTGVDFSIDIISDPSTLLDESLAPSEFYSSESDRSIEHSNPGESPVDDSVNPHCNSPSTPTSRRPSSQQRTRRGQLSLRQKSQLQEAFLKCPNPTESQQQNLSKKIGITVNSVQKWFSKQQARCIHDNHEYLYDNLDIWMGATSNRTNLLPELSSSNSDTEDTVYYYHD